MGEFTPTPNEGQPIVPGQPLQPSWPTDLANGVSLATVAELNANLTDFYAKLALWEQARQDVETEITLVLSWVEVANTFVSKILPQILSIVKASQASSAATGATSSLSGIMNLVSGLPQQIGQFQGLISQITGLLKPPVA